MEHYPALESDFQRYYGLDLRECLWGGARLGARRLVSLVDGLPPESALARTLDPDNLGSGWTADTHLLAVIVQLVDHANRLFMSANSKPGSRIPDPIHIRRPGDERRRAEAMDTVATLQSKGIPVFSVKRGDSPDG